MSEPRVCTDARKKVKNILLVLQKKSRRTRPLFVLVRWLDAQDPEQVSGRNAVRAAHADHAAGERIPAGEFIDRGPAQAEHASRSGDIDDHGKREYLGPG